MKLTTLTPLAALAFSSLLIGCARQERGDDAVLAVVDGEPVRLADVDSLVGDRLALMDYQHLQERHSVIEAALQRSIRDRVLEKEAAVRGMTLEEFTSQATQGRVDVSEEEIADFYQRNVDVLGSHQLEDIHDEIETYLADHKRDAVLDDLSAQFSDAHDVDIMLEPVRVQLDNEGSPARGPAGAPVTLTEFSDFQCPYCRRFFDTVNRLAQQYGDRLRIVYRQYPLESHPDAYKAAEASLCADDQGSFWAMHDLLFTERDSLGVDALKRKAGRLGLDQAEFDGCLDSGSQADRIDRDIREGDRLGITGTPFVFVNGAQVPGGAAPYDVISQMIDEELERTGG